MDWKIAMINLRCGGARLRDVAWMALGLPLALAGCASVYLNDADLAKKTDVADAMVQAADTLKPYTAELANIDAFSAQQDQAIAARDVAQRDKWFAGHVSEPPATLLKSLDGDACAKLEKLVRPAVCADTTGADQIDKLQTRLLGFQRLVLEDLATAAASRAAYERVRAPADHAADDCTSVLSKPASADMAADAAAAFGRLKGDCTSLATAQDQVTHVLIAAKLDPAAALAEAEHDASQAIAKTSLIGLDDAALNKAIGEAKNLANSGNVADLKTLQDKVEDVLKYASPAAKLSGLKQVQNALDGVLTGLVCPPGSTDPKCTAVVAASTTGRTEAVWTGLEALAQYFDANDPRYRSASWLTAANAILAAEKTDAQIQDQAAKDAAALAAARANRLWREAAYLAQVHRIAQTVASPDLAALCPNTPAAYCALEIDLDAWNSGVIPNDVLQARETLVFARAAVRRQQAAQTEQQALARAASTSLKSYADGGIPPAVIAQLLVDLGLTAAVAAK